MVWKLRLITKRNWVVRMGRLIVLIKIIRKMSGFG